MDDLLSHLKCLDGCRDEMIELVIDLCDRNSGTLNISGIENVAAVLTNRYTELGGELKSLPVNPMESVDTYGDLQHQELGRAIHIVKRPNIRPRALLCIHMDTVYGRDHRFQTCRWIDERTLNGPGVADAKGGLVVMLYALKALEQSPLAEKIGWEVIMNPDEELGSPGSTQFLHERARQADIGLLFEPSHPDGGMISWRKGAGNFTFVVRGRSAHSGRDFHEGRNAVVALSKLFAEIDQWNGDSDETFNCASCRGGDAPNMVPDLAIGVVNVRVRTTEQLKNAESKLKNLVNRFDGQNDIRVEMHGCFRSPPKPLDAETEDLQKRIELCANALEMPIHWKGTGGASDGNKFSAVGLPNIDTLGAQGGSIHSEDEFMLVDSLVPRAKLAALVMLSLAAEQS